MIMDEYIRKKRSGGPEGRGQGCVDTVPTVVKR